MCIRDSIRARPAARREVRLTISAGPSGGRAATLATPLQAFEMARGRDDVVASEGRERERPFGAAKRGVAAAQAPMRAAGPRRGPGAARAEAADPCAAQRAAVD